MIEPRGNSETLQAALLSEADALRKLRNRFGSHPAYLNSRTLSHLSAGNVRAVCSNNVYERNSFSYSHNHNLVFHNCDDIGTGCNATIILAQLLRPHGPNLMDGFWSSAHLAGSRSFSLGSEPFQLRHLQASRENARRTNKGQVDAHP